MFLGKISVLIVLHLIGVAIILNRLRFKSSFRLLIGLYIYFFVSYLTAAKILSLYPKIWNPIEAGLVDPKKINPAYK